MIEVYAVNLNKALTEEEFHRLLCYVSAEKCKKINRFHRYEDAQRSLISDVLTRRIISNRLGLNNNEIIFEYNEYGKPALSKNMNLHFNTSHAGQWVVCAVHRLPVGIDVERIQPIEFDIAKRFFCQEEYQELMQREDTQRLSGFYELWTLKEAYIKAVGKGLSIPLNSFFFQFRSEEIIFHSKQETKKYNFKQYNIDPAYKMAVCGLEDTFAVEVNVFKTEELFLF